MLAPEHVETAREFLEVAYREFERGDVLQGSEKMWGAASHAIIAVAQDKGWPHGSHYDLREGAERLTEERGDPLIRSGFGIAEKFHANFYHGFMSEREREISLELVRDFVERVLTDSQNGRA